MENTAIWGSHSFVTSKRPSSVSLIANVALLLSCFVAVLVYPLPSQIAIIASIAFFLAYTSLYRVYGCAMKKTDSDKARSKMTFEGWLFSAAVFVMSLFVVALSLQAIPILL